MVVHVAVLGISRPWVKGSYRTDPTLVGLCLTSPIWGACVTDPFFTGSIHAGFTLNRKLLESLSDGVLRGVYSPIIPNSP